MLHSAQHVARTDSTEACPYCQRSCDVVPSRCGERMECLCCGALWSPGRHASDGVIGLRYELTRDPREEIEDPDERPYLWDL